MFQFTHPGKGATDDGSIKPFAEFSVSIHAPWEGCDQAGLVAKMTLTGFNSRTLGRVRLATKVVDESVPSVSIHAPWEGCDARVDCL